MRGKSHLWHPIGLNRCFPGRPFRHPRHQGRWREHLRTSKRQHVRVAAPPGWDRHDQSARRNAVRAAPTVADRHGELRGNKNDYNDALAIAEAVTRPEMRFSAINTQEQQDIQALHRLRERRIQERTALCNQVRGLLAEYGLIIKVGVRSLQRKLPDLLEDAENGLRDVFRRYLIQLEFRVSNIVPPYIFG